MVLNRIVAVLKYLVITLAIFFVLVLTLVNLPFSQRFITNKANRIFREKGLPVQTDRITLLVDGRIGLRNVRIIRSGGDTVVYAGNIRGSVRIFPLLFRKVKVTNLSISETVVNLASEGPERKLNLISLFSKGGKESGSKNTSGKKWDIGAETVTLEKVRFTYNDSIKGISLRESVGKLIIRFDRLSTSSKEIYVASIEMNHAHGGISTGRTSPENKGSVSDEKKAPWKFRVREADLNDIAFSLGQPAQGTGMDFLLKAGKFSDSEFDLSGNRLIVGKMMLETPGVDISASGNKPEQVARNEIGPDKGLAGDLRIKAGEVKISKGFFNSHDTRVAGNDSAGKREFNLNGLNADFSNIRLDSTDAGFTLDNLSFELGNRFSLEEGDITFSSGTGGKTQLEAGLRTASSKIQLEFESDGDISKLLSSLHTTPISVKLSDTKIGAADAMSFLPALTGEKMKKYRDLTVGVNCSISGTVDSLAIGNLLLDSPWGIPAEFSGWLAGIMDPRTMRFSLNFGSGSLTRTGIANLLSFAGSLIKLPEFEPFTLRGNISGDYNNPACEFTLSGNSGIISSSGSLSLPEKSYDLKMDIISQDAGKLTGINDLKDISGKVAAKGKGFDPKAALLEASVAIDTLSFRGYSYKDIKISLEGEKGEYAYSINSADTSFYCSLAGGVSLGDKSEKGTIKGSLNIDAGRLNLVKGYSAGATIEAGLARSETGLEGNLRISKLELHKQNKSEELEKLEISFNSSDSLFAGELNSDFMKAGFRCQSSIGYLKKVFADRKFRGIAMVDSAVSNRIPFVSGLPVMKVTVETTYDPIIGLILNDTVFGYHYFRMDLSKDSAGTASAEISVDRFNYGAMRGYRTLVGMKRTPAKSELQVKTDSLTIGSISLSRSALDISTRGDTAVCEIVAGGSQDMKLFSVSVDVFKDGKVIKFRSSQPQWIINGFGWEVSPGEFLKIIPEENDLITDLHWRNDQSSIDVTGRKTEKLILDLRKVGISTLLLKGLNASGYDGELTGTVGYKGYGTRNELDLDMGLDGFRFSENVLGDFDIKGHYSADTIGNMGGDLKVVMNDTSHLDVKADIGERGLRKEINADFSGIPLMLLESVAGKYISRTQGDINGNLEMKSRDRKPELNGQIGFNNTALTVVPLNARFYLSDDLILLKNNKLVFDQFTVLDSLKKKLSVNGDINLGDLRNITADLTIISDRLQVMNTSEKDNASFNGSVFVNSKLEISGPLQKPSISGKIVLAEGSVINYRYTENLAVSETQKTITFASLSGNQNATGRGSSGNIGFSRSPNIEASVEIDPGSLFTFQISRGFDISASIKGGGFLNYDQITGNAISLSGTYEIKQGSAELKIPGWPRKDFTIAPGSFLKWSGAADDPELNISTSSKVRGSYYNPVEDKNREVNFIVNMKLTNHLSQLDILFDVGSNDQYITSVFNTLSADERMKQAINLLIFARIELPNMESSSDYVTQQINQFWESQINQFTKSAIKGVDLSFGIDTYTGVSKGGGEQTYTSFTYEVKKEMFHERGSVLVSGRMNDASQAGAPTNNMIENFIFEYALDTARTKYFKVYRQQDYEDLLEGEVTKSGLGFIYRKSYDRIRDIWRKEKNRKNKSDTR